MESFVHKSHNYKDDLAANQPSKAKLAYKIIIFATATVKLITEILHCIGS